MTVLTDAGPVEIAVPVTVADLSSRRSSASGRSARPAWTKMAISLPAKGLTTCEVQARLTAVHGAEASRHTISTIADNLHVRIRDGAAANRPIYVTLSVTAEGRGEARPRKRHGAIDWGWPEEDRW
ncbi:transposase [Streptomyces sp. NPDC005506]|uniref:transposase n=1 Tax=unclassified Streptomyces TaxID=2593676 RepID=UPI0036C79787